MKYITTYLEDSVQKLYQKMDVKDPNHSIIDIANRLEIYISFCILPFSIPRNIILDPLLSKEKQKEVFAHELGHRLNHAGLQTDIPDEFRRLQEYQAINFALHFCIPTFMLLKIDMPRYRNQAIQMIAETFGVTCEFSKKRLNHFEKQIQGALFHENLMKCSEMKEKYIL